MANRDSNWTNKDGLVVGFGTRSVESTFSAKPSVKSYVQEIVCRVKGADLADAVVTEQLVHAPVIPAGAHIQSATLYVKTAFAGTNAVMDIGLYNLAGTAVNDAGIDAAIAVTAIDADDDEVACDGALVGTVVDVACKVGVTYDTAAFTAGDATLVLKYQVPLT